MTEEEGVLLAFVGLFVIFIGITMFLVGLTLYILQAIGLFKIAKNEGRGDLAWLAWIPIASAFLLTLLVEKSVHKEFRGKVTLIYGITFVASIILINMLNVLVIFPLFFIGYILMFIIGYLPMVVYYYAFFFLAKKFSPNPVLHIVIAVVTFGAAIPIQIFIFRNRESIAPQEPEAMVDNPEW